MKSLLLLVLTTLQSALRSRSDLLLEIAALRGQLAIYQRQVRRPKLRRGDRMFWAWLSQHWSGWKRALVIVKPETVLRWHRQGFKLYWRNRSGGGPGRPRILGPTSASYGESRRTTPSGVKTALP